MSEWTDESLWRDKPIWATLPPLLQDEFIAMPIADYQRALACVRLCAGHVDLAKCEVVGKTELSGLRQGEARHQLQGLGVDVRMAELQQVKDFAKRALDAEAELATLREQLAARVRIGHQMSNVMYNLSQSKKHLPDDVKSMMHDLAKEWDSIARQEGWAS